jgi:tetratricopeptide (TPR) repeat protein
MKNIFTFLLLSCLSFLVWAQQDDVHQLIRLAQEEQLSNSSPGESLARWLQVFNRIKEANEHPQYPDVCIAIAGIYMREELNSKALEYYLQASRALVKKDQFDPQLEEVYSNVARIYAQLPKLDSMRYFYQKILSQKEKTNRSD